jgi:oxaloacetate decarboxylase alpha subunit
MSRRITIRDTTIRDGHQSLWATRMSTAMMLPVAEHIERSGIDSVDIMAHVHMDAAVRFAKDDPWERMDALTRAMPRLVRNAWTSGKNTWGFRFAPDDIFTLGLDLTLEHGATLMSGMNGLLDLDATAGSLQYAKDRGAQTAFGLVYTVSPIHTDELYEQKAREIVQRSDVDYIMIKDPGGLLTPATTGPLVDAIRRGAGDVKLTLHSHDTAGMGGAVYMKGVEHGVDDLQLAIWPLALGYSQPSMQTTIRNLRELGYEVDVDDAEIEAASQHIAAVAKRYNFPIGAPLPYDHAHYLHQVPGGMLSNLHSQLKAAGLLDRMDELLQEIPRVREELGWPAMVTPFSQIVGATAMLNVVNGKRYQTIPDELAHYALGHYGALLSPIDPNLLDRIFASRTPESYPGPAEMEPALPRLRKAHPNASPEELYLRFMIPDAAVQEMLQEKVRRNFEPERLDLTPRGKSVITALLRQAASLSKARSVDLNGEGYRISLVK